MTNGEKFKQTFGFGVDGSRVIAVNSTWWDCEFQNSKPMSDELVKRLRDAATMSEALAVLLPHSEGNATAKLYNEAADAIETLLHMEKRKDASRCLDFIPKPTTKADQIRAMANEELAEFLYATWKEQDEFSKEVCEKCGDIDTGCRPNCWLNWLKQEVEK